MKKLSFLIAVFTIFSSANLVFAEGFDNLDNLTFEQKLILTQIYQDYKAENNDLENQIMNYSDKISRLRQSTDKTPEQISLLISVYERNIETLKNQQTLLEKQTNKLYQDNMTPEQFMQYNNQQLNVQDAFSKFLQK